MSDMEKNVPCDFEAELPLLLYQGELAREEREGLKSHLATCARCAEALAQLEATAVVLDGAMAVPKPSAEQWQKLKSDVLARVAAPVAATGNASSSSPTAHLEAGDEPCESVEEDLLVLNELGFDRKKAVSAHLEKCASCRDTRSAFGSIGIVLNRQPLVWPAIERWDSLKDSVLSTVDGQVTPRPSARLQPAASIRRVSWATFTRAAAGVVLLVGVTGALALLRGPSAEDVRRFYRDAQGGGTLAVVAHNYELVVQKGIDKPECRTEVDDALLQLQAIHHFERALGQPTTELKILMLRDGIVRFPGVQVTQLALSQLNELAPPAGPTAPPPVAYKKSGFEDPGEQRFRVDPTFIQRYTESLESQYVAIKDLQDERSLKKKSELRGALVAGYVQMAQSETEKRDVALGYYKKALNYVDPGSPAANDILRHVEALSR